MLTMLRHGISLLLLLLPLCASDKCLTGDCVNGEGYFKWSDGERYWGTFEDGKPSGLGVFRVPKSQTYAGEWADGVRARSGVMSFKDGRKYRGTWGDGGKMHGVGVQEWTGARRKAKGLKDEGAGMFQGGFAGNRWHGAGRLTRHRVKDPEGKHAELTNEGEFKEGKLTKPLDAEAVEAAVAQAEAAAEKAEQVAKLAQEIKARLKAEVKRKKQQRQEQKKKVKEGL